MMRLRAEDYASCRPGMEGRDLLVVTITIWMKRFLHRAGTFVQGMTKTKGGLKGERR